MRATFNCIIFFYLIVLTSGCKKNIDGKAEHGFIFSQPKSQDIDINNDGIMDFRIDFKLLVPDDYSSSGKSWIGYVQPLDKNEILYKQIVGNLFLQKKDTVFSTSTSTKIWYPNSANLITNTGKDSNWTILASNNIADYYLGFKLKSSSRNMIGWMKVDIQKNTGIISLANKKLTEADFLIIDE